MIFCDNINSWVFRRFRVQSTFALTPYLILVLIVLSNRTEISQLCLGTAKKLREEGSRTSKGQGQIQSGLGTGSNMSEIPAVDLSTVSPAKPPTCVKARWNVLFADPICCGVSWLRENTSGLEDTHTLVSDRKQGPDACMGVCRRWAWVG